MSFANMGSKNGSDNDSKNDSNNAAGWMIGTLLIITFMITKEKLLWVVGFMCVMLIVYVCGDTLDEIDKRYYWKFNYRWAIWLRQRSRSCWAIALDNRRRGFWDYRSVGTTMKMRLRTFWHRNRD